MYYFSSEHKCLSFVPDISDISSLCIFADCECARLPVGKAHKQVLMYFITKLN